MATHTAMAQGGDASLRSSLEQRIGIIHFVSPRQHSWQGQIRTRYTDFQVNEISKDGQVVHLTDFHTNAKEYAAAVAPPQPPQQASTAPGVNEQKVKEAAVTTDPISEEQKENGSKTGAVGDSDTVQTSPSPADRALLAELVGADTSEKLLELYAKINDNPKAKAQSHGSVQIPAIDDKQTRSRVHTEIRRIFAGKIDTTTGSENTIKAVASGSSGQRWPNSNNDRSRNPRQNQGQQIGGKFLHFSLYKENKDTMDAVGYLSRVLKLKNKDFGVAGTKDRRAVTVQRVSMRGRNPQTLVFINNNRIPGVKIGDFKFEEESLRLGCHGGNEFVIVMKNCVFDGTAGMPFEQAMTFAKDAVETALENTKQHGFLNYFGTQRFGTYEIGTQDIGIKILRDDFEGAVKSLLAYDPDLVQVPDEEEGDRARKEDIMRAKACSLFLETGDFQAAYKLLPRRCHAEFNMMRHLEKQPKDYLGAIQSIARGMRTMYVHAYQSLVWNYAASKRWALFGNQVVKGDLVLQQADASADATQRMSEDFDEENIHLQEDDSKADSYQGPRARILSEEEANSGEYSIFDIVLPTPGFDVLYPGNEIGQFYTEFMAKEENGALDPNNMRRRQRDFSLPGSYRRLMGSFIKAPSVSVQSYSSDLEQLVPTDLDLIMERRKTSRTGRQHEQPRAERRKAESPADGEEPSNKRVKVASETAIAGEGSINDSTSASTPGQTNDSELVATETPTTEHRSSEGLAMRQPQTQEPVDSDVAAKPESSEQKIAVILRIALDTSQYATMAIRELQGPFVDGTKSA